MDFLSSALFTAEPLNVLYPVVQLLTVISLVIGVYVALKREVRREGAEVKKHTDVSVRKLNGLNVESLIHSMDRPAWVKVAVSEAGGPVEFRMLTMNRQYERAFGKTRDQYLGRTDREAGWDAATCAQFYDHDLYIWQTGQPSTVVEVCDGIPYRFRKVRVSTPDGIPKGILGFSVEENGVAENYKIAPKPASLIPDRRPTVPAIEPPGD